MDLNIDNYLPPSLDERWKWQNLWIQTSQPSPKLRREQIDDKTLMWYCDTVFLESHPHGHGRFWIYFRRSVGHLEASLRMSESKSSNNPSDLWYFAVCCPEYRFKSFATHNDTETRQKELKKKNTRNVLAPPPTKQNREVLNCTKRPLQNI